MKKKKSIVAIMMVVVMCMLSACGTKFDAKAYIKSCLDVQFKGEFEEYMKLTESSKADSEKFCIIMELMHLCRDMKRYLFLKNWKTNSAKRIRKC